MTDAERPASEAICEKRCKYRRVGRKAGMEKGPLPNLFHRRAEFQEEVMVIGGADMGKLWEEYFKTRICIEGKRSKKRVDFERRLWWLLAERERVKTHVGRPGTSYGKMHHILLCSSAKYYRNKYF